MYDAGDEVTYVGGMAELAGMPGVVQGPGSKPGRSVVTWTKLRSIVDMSDTVLKKEERVKPVAQIKMDITEVRHIQQYADRSVDIHATDRVRGEIIIRAQEDEVRWLHAQLCDMVTAWRKSDGED
jgi:hypothetical protein